MTKVKLNCYFPLPTEEDVARDNCDIALTDVYERMKKLPAKTALGLLRGFDKAVAVAEKHVGSHGEHWLNREFGQHADHAYDHIEIATFDPHCSAIDDDGLPHLDHAACRILFAIAMREGM